MNRFGVIENVPCLDRWKRGFAQRWEGGSTVPDSARMEIDAKYILLSNGGRPHTVGKPAS